VKDLIQKNSDGGEEGASDRGTLGANETLGVKVPLLEVGVSLRLMVGERVGALVVLLTARLAVGVCEVMEVGVWLGGNVGAFNSHPTI